MDDTLGAARASVWAAHLAARSGAVVIAIHALAIADDYLATGVRGKAERNAARKLAGPWTEELRKLDVPTRTILTHDDPGVALARLARTVRADLVVLGRSRQARWTPAHLGLVTHRVLQDAVCPVAIIPDAVRYRSEKEARAVVVGANGSTGAAAALRFATPLAKVLGMALRTVHAVERRDFEDSSFEDRTAAKIPETDCAESGAVEERNQHAVEGSVVLVGKPEAVLLGAAEEAEVLVVGSRHRHPIGELFHGSTSHYCAARARCPVVLVPPAGRLPSPDSAGRE